MKIERVLLLIMVGAIMMISLASCVDTVRSDGLSEQVSTLTARVNHLEIKVKLREAEIDNLDERLSIDGKFFKERRTNKTNIRTLFDEINEHRGVIDALVVIVTQHEDDFYYVYRNLGWSGEAFQNWERHSSLWEAAWGCSGPCGSPSYILREYK